MNQRNDRLLCADFTALPELETDHLKTSTYKAPNIIITNLTSYNEKRQKKHLEGESGACYNTTLYLM